MTKNKVELIVKVGPKGQIVLRKELREALGIRSGSMVRTELVGKKIIIKPLDLEREVKEIEALAKKISKKWPKHLSAVEAIRGERR